MVSHPNLLVSDDDSAFRQVLCEGLSRYGFRVTEARDGAEAVEKATHVEIHLALVDLHMPRLNGLDVVRHLMRMPASPPCVLMSAKLDDEIRREAERMQVYQVLSKPIRFRQLAGLVCGAMAERYGWSQEPE